MDDNLQSDVENMLELYKILVKAGKHRFYKVHIPTPGEKVMLQLISHAHNEAFRALGWTEGSTVDNQQVLYKNNFTGDYRVKTEIMPTDLIQETYKSALQSKLNSQGIYYFRGTRMLKDATLNGVVNFFSNDARGGLWTNVFVDLPPEIQAYNIYLTDMRKGDDEMALRKTIEAFWPKGYV